MGAFRSYLNERPVKEQILTKNDLINVENFLDKLYNNIGIDLNIHGKHFIDRLNSTIETGKAIYLREVKQLFTKIYNQYHDELVKLAKNKEMDIELILQDINKDINIPVILTKHEKFSKEMAAKTVIKKKDFVSSNAKLVV